MRAWLSSNNFWHNNKLRALRHSQTGGCRAWLAGGRDAVPVLLPCCCALSPPARERGATRRSAAMRHGSGAWGASGVPNHPDVNECTIQASFFLSPIQTDNYLRSHPWCNTDAPAPSKAQELTGGRILHATARNKVRDSSIPSSGGTVPRGCLRNELVFLSPAIPSW